MPTMQGKLRQLFRYPRRKGPSCTRIIGEKGIQVWAFYYSTLSEYRGFYTAKREIAEGLQMGDCGGNGHRLGFW